MINQIQENQSSYTNLLKEEGKTSGRRITEVETQMQEEVPFARDILSRILERLERLEKTKDMAWKSIANRS